MKIAFYCPLKPVSHPNPSGDREIARGLHSFLSEKNDLFVLSEFRTRLFYQKKGEWGRWWRELLAAYRLARKEKPDLFFTYHLYYKAPDPIGFLLSWWFNKPYFVFEGMYARRNARRRGYWRGYWLTKLALRQADAIFSDKTEDFSFLEQWFPGKAVYLPPSVEVEDYAPSAKGRERARSSLGLASVDPVIVTIAMLRPDRKTEGVEFLIRCLKKLKDEGLGFHWLHVGGGAEEGRIRRRAAEDLGERARVLGTVPREKVKEALAAGDLFAFPGLDEGFGLVYVEAQAAGLPVVAFRNGGIPDAVLEGESAFLTPVLEEAPYCDALRKLILDEGIRSRMGRAGQAFAARKFDRRRNYGKMLERMESSLRS